MFLALELNTPQDWMINPTWMSLGKLKEKVKRVKLNSSHSILNSLMSIGKALDGLPTKS